MKKEHNYYFFINIVMKNLEIKINMKKNIEIIHHKFLRYIMVQLRTSFYFLALFSFIISNFWFLVQNIV